MRFHTLCKTIIGMADPPFQKYNPPPPKAKKDPNGKKDDDSWKGPLTQWCSRERASVASGVVEDGAAPAPTD